MNPRRRLTATVAAGVLAVTAVLVVPAGAAGASTVGAASTRAVRYAQAHHLTSGIAIVDTRTGVLYSAGRSTRRFTSASVVKTLIATRLLLQHKLHGHDAALAHLMITESDNAAADALYAQVGRDALLPALARHYRIVHLGAPPTTPGRWGTTQLTARGLARFYAAVRHDHRVWPWLGHAMHSYRARSSAGEPNAWGIAAAAPLSAVKNGWVQHGPHAFINTTGFVDHDRYAVVILGEGPAALYYRAGEAIASHEARLIMPHGVLHP